MTAEIIVNFLFLYHAKEKHRKINMTLGKLSIILTF